jgi:hypothetical protein
VASIVTATSKKVYQLSNPAHLKWIEELAESTLLSSCSMLVLSTLQNKPCSAYVSWAGFRSTIFSLILSCILNPSFFHRPLRHVRYLTTINGPTTRVILTRMCSAPNTLVLSYRGAVMKPNWKQNFNYNKIKYALQDPSLKTENAQKNPSKAQVHEGFLTMFLETASAILKQIPNYLINNRTEIIVTGHSMGGALAMLAAMELAQHYSPHRIQLLTFAAPRVGNQAFANLVHATLPFVLRVIEENDLIPHLPITTFMKYFHAGAELYVQSELLIVCLDPEDMHCSTKRLPLISPTPHLKYRGNLIFGEATCESRFVKYYNALGAHIPSSYYSISKKQIEN